MKYITVAQAHPRRLPAATSCLLLFATVGSIAACSTESPVSASRDGADGKAACIEDGECRVGFLPKTTSDPFFVAANEGAEEAAEELGLELIYKGPATYDTAGQIPIISQWVQQQVDAITISANDPNASVPALKQASEAGVRVSAWNADVDASARQFFLNNPTAADLGEALAEQVAETIDGSGNVLVLTSTLTAPNQNAWLEQVESYSAENLPEMELMKVLPGEADVATSFNVVKSWLQAHPETDAVLTLDGNGLKGAAQAVDSLGLKGEVHLTGIGVPSQNGSDIKSGLVHSAVLWNPVDLGYATMYMVHAQLEGTLDDAESLEAGRLGTLEFESDDTITLGEPLVFTADNVDDYDF
jgi:rhamnose transport system substrate-binding protein